MTEYLDPCYFWTPGPIFSEIFGPLLKYFSIWRLSMSNVSFFVCLMLMMFTHRMYRLGVYTIYGSLHVPTTKYSVIKHCSLVSHFSLCDYYSLRRLSLSSFPRSFRFQMAKQRTISLERPYQRNMKRQ